MNHRRARRQLNDYLDGDLELEERTRLDEHLSGCDDCAREARELRQTVFLLRDLPTEAGPPGIAEAVMARVHAGHARPTRLPQWAGLSRWLSDSGGSLALAAGVTALLIVVAVDPVGIGQQVADSGGLSGAFEASLHSEPSVDPEPSLGPRLTATRSDARTAAETRRVSTQPTRPTRLRVQPVASGHNPTGRPAAFGSRLLPLPSPMEAPSPSVDDVLDALLRDPESFVIQMQRSIRDDRGLVVERLARRATIRGDDAEAVSKLGAVDQPYAPMLAELFRSRALAFRNRSR